MDRRSAAVVGRDSDQSGMTLIELMAAIFILSIVLAAAAASLIGFTRSIHVEERRVVATSLLAASNEQFQAVEFDLVGIYDRDLAALSAIGVDATATPPVFVDDGSSHPIAVLVDPDNEDCPSLEPNCGEDPGVEPAYKEVSTGGFDFELFRVVTWVDRSGDGVPDVKRLTSIVRWEVLGRDYEERFDTERAATRQESAAPGDLRMFTSLGPSRMALDEQHRTTRDIGVYVRFNRPVVPGQVRITYYAIDQIIEPEEEGDPTIVTFEEHDVPLDEVPGALVSNTEFRLTIDAGDRRFTNGPRLFRITGRDSTGEAVSVQRAIRFDGELPYEEDPMGAPEGSGSDEENGGGGGESSVNPDLVPVAIATPTVSRTQVRVRNNDGRTRCAFTVEAVVDGMYPDDHQVTLQATGVSGGNEQFAPAMDPDGTTISPNGHRFYRTFEAGVEYFSEGDTVRFLVTARRPSDGDEVTPVQTTQQVTFTTASTSGCN